MTKGASNEWIAHLNVSQFSKSAIFLIQQSIMLDDVDMGSLPGLFKSGCVRRGLATSSMGIEAGADTVGLDVGGEGGIVSFCHNGYFQYRCS